MAEYRRLSVSLGIEVEETPTGLDLQRASASLLRSAALAEAAAAQSPAARSARAVRAPAAAPLRGTAGREACGTLPEPVPGSESYLCHQACASQ